MLGNTVMSREDHEIRTWKKR